MSGRVDRCAPGSRSTAEHVNLIALQHGVNGKGVSSTSAPAAPATNPFRGSPRPASKTAGARRSNSFPRRHEHQTASPRGGITNLKPNPNRSRKCASSRHNLSAVTGQQRRADQVITRAAPTPSRESRSTISERRPLGRKSSRRRSPTSEESVRLHVRRPTSQPAVFFTSYEGLAKSGARSLVHGRETDFRNFVHARRVPKSMPPSCGENMPPRPTRPTPRSWRPATARTDGPPDGIRMSGRVLVRRRAERNQLAAARLRARPGRDRLYCNMYRTTCTRERRNPAGVPCRFSNHAIRNALTRNVQREQANEFAEGQRL